MKKLTAMLTTILMIVLMLSMNACSPTLEYSFTIGGKTVNCTRYEETNGNLSVWECDSKLEYTCIPTTSDVTNTKIVRTIREIPSQCLPCIYGTTEPEASGTAAYR